MIFKGETLNRKREVEFALQAIADPSSPVTGFNWGAAASGVLKLRAPGGTLVAADNTRVTEIGGGTYVYALTDTDVSLAGTGNLQIDASIAVAVALSYPFEVVDPADFRGAGDAGSGTALPAGPVTLTALIDAVRTRGDYLSSLTFTAAYLTREIQAAWTELYELISNTHEGYWDKSSTVATVSGQAYVALPSDYWRVQAIDILDGNQYRRLRQVGLKDRNRYSATSAMPTAYRLSARGAELFATPNAIYTLRVSYTPVVTTLDDAGIQLFGWEEYIIVGALLRLDQRQEKPLGERQQELERCKQRVIAAAGERKSAEPEYLNLHLHDDDLDGYNPGGY